MMRAAIFCLLLALVLPADAARWAVAARVGAVVSGNIAHAQDNSVSITLRTDPLTGQEVEIVQATLDANGNFRLDLPAVKQPQEGILRHGDDFVFVFLAPGDELSLMADGERFGRSLRFAGASPAAAANTYLAQEERQLAKQFPTGFAAVVHDGTLPQALHFIQQEQQQRRANLWAYAAAHSVTPAFRAYVRQSAAFAEANNRLMLPGLFEDPNHVAPALPKGYFDFLPALRPMQDSAFVANVAAYHAFMGAFANTRLAVGGLPARGEVLLAAVAQQFGAGPSRDVVLAKFMHRQLQERDAADLAPLLPAFRRVVADSALARAVRAQFRRRLVLAAGQVAPALALSDEQGRPVALADFAGKVVYLDFWASWCGPCLEELPASAVLEKQFAGRDVVFLHVAVDDEEANWKKALAQYPLAGANRVHTWARGLGSAAPRAYQVEGVPSYFIVGRDGRMVNSRAPRPSDGPAAAAALDRALAR